MLGASVAGPLIEMLGRVVELGRVVVAVWRASRPPDPRPADLLADLLAKAVNEQWRQEAAERMLLTPEPIPVGWSLSELAVTGPVEAAVGSANVAPRFPPLPGQSRVTEEQLGAGGGRRELFAVYAGIASGRVVVLGAPGAGKTGSAVLLVLDALEHREGVEDTQRARVPVPVLVSACGWDPVSCSARDWLVDRLVASYPRLFAHRGSRAEAAALVDAGVVALVLDGLDEMGVTLRRAALRALSDAPFRVVVLTRGKEMVQAAGVAWLVGALALELREVTGPEGAEYLHRAPTGPPPSGWSQLLTHLREHPGSVLARGLSTPLALTLVRDTYRPGDDLSGLLTTGWSTAEEIERYLIARVVPAAYTHWPGRPVPRYSQAQAEQVLVFLARQMNQDHTRDLAWWQIPRWVPATPRLLASMLATGLLGAILSALVFTLVVLLCLVLLAFSHGVGQGLWTVLGRGLLLGLVFGFGVGLPIGIGVGRGGREPQRVRSWRAVSWRSVLTAGLVYGLGAAMLVGMLVGAVVPDRTAIPGMLVVDLVGGLVGGLTFVLSGWRGEDQGSPPELVTSRHKERLFGLVAGLVLGLVAGVVAVRSFHLGLVSGFAVGLAAMLVFGLVSRLAGGLVVGLAVGSADGEPSSPGPRETWHHDRAFRLRVGLVVGLGAGLGAGLDVGLVLGLGLVAGLANFLVVVLANFLVVVLANFLVVVLAIALVYGITSSVTWSTTLAWHQLRLARRVPAVALMPFLEDARDRGVLRTEGAVYQFRHATLQDKLAGQTILSPPTSASAQTGA